MLRTMLLSALAAYRRQELTAASSAAPFNMVYYVYYRCDVSLYQPVCMYMVSMSIDEDCGKIVSANANADETAHCEYLGGTICSPGLSTFVDDTIR
jgi:hypothetical protein